MEVLTKMDSDVKSKPCSSSSSGSSSSNSKQLVASE
jgi:hypothetical protein